MNFKKFLIYIFIGVVMLGAIGALFKENGVAILFPYLRSELTLLTTQPGFQPIVLPAVNIAKMFQN